MRNSRQTPSQHRLSPLVPYTGVGASLKLAPKPRAVLSSDLSMSPRSGRFGCLEKADSEGLSGWALEAGDLTFHQGVTILLDGVEVFRGKANVLRPDVSKLLDRHAYSGFKFKWAAISPRGPIATASNRLGRLIALTDDDEQLPIDCLMSSADMYAKVDFYVDRLALVLGVTEVTEFQTRDDRGLVAEEFDAAFYTRMYPAAGIDERAALDNFMATGWRHGHDPNASFSTSYYIRANNDVHTANVNPFVHFLRSGRAEGRQGYPPGGFRLDSLRELRPLGETVALWQRKEGVRCLAQRTLQQRLEARLAESGAKVLVVSYSHDDYTRNVGGVQLCLSKEERAFTAQGALYLHLSPWQPLPVLAPPGNPARLAMRVLCDGLEIGNALGADVVSAVTVLARHFPSAGRHLVVHALHGHSPEHVAQIHDALQPARSLFWLHDYFSICTGYNLLRNQIQFCGGPPASSSACSVCVFGESRGLHEQRMKTLFNAVPFVTIAPSQHTTDLWTKLSSLPTAGMSLLPHCLLEHDGSRMAAATGGEVVEGGVQAPMLPIRVAFLGHPSLHKGWPVFLNLVRHLCNDTHFEFWHLGTAQETSLPIQFQEVKVSPEQPLAMIAALEDCAIDVAVQWSIWPETFGITARECAAAGVFVLTSSVSGAVAEFVRSTGAGLALDQEQDLLDLFKGKGLLQCVASRRSDGVPVGVLAWSRLSADLLMSTDISHTAQERA